MRWTVPPVPGRGEQGAEQAMAADVRLSAHHRTESVGEMRRQRAHRLADAADRGRAVEGGAAFVMQHRHAQRREETADRLQFRPHGLGAPCCAPPRRFRPHRAGRHCPTGATSGTSRNSSARRPAVASAASVSVAPVKSSPYQPRRGIGAMALSPSCRRNPGRDAAPAAPPRHPPAGDRRAPRPRPGGCCAPRHPGRRDGP